MAEMRARLIGMLGLLALAATGPAAADPASVLSGLAEACPMKSMGLSRQTLALTVKEGVLTVSQSLLFFGDSAFRPAETFTLRLSRVRVLSAGTDFQGQPQLALTCRGEPAFCITVTDADGAVKPNIGVVFLTACDKAAARAMAKTLRKLS